MNLLQHKSRIFLPIDWKTFLPVMLLCVIGCITLLSTSILPEGGYGDLSIVWKQIAAIGIGLVLFFIISFIDLSYFKYWQVLLITFAITAGLLILTLMIGPVINGTRRWLPIGGFQLQPSEIAKFAVIVITAGIFSMRGRLNELILVSITFLLTAVLFVLIYLEPGGSMSLLTLSIWFLMTFLALSNPLRNTLLILIMGSLAGGFLVAAVTNNWLWYLTTILGIVLTVFILYSKTNWKALAIGALVLGLILGIFFTISWDTILHDYQKNRIIAFINPTEQTVLSDEGFNVNQSKIAIGSGQLLGKGFGNGTQSKRNFLPEHQTDFIFASFAEEFGLVGSMFVLGLYGFLILHCFLTAITVIQDPLSSLLCLGVGIKLLLEVFINLGTNMGTIPATGIPLPFMSAGGTITIMTFVCLGLVQNVYLKYQQGHHDRSNEILDMYED